MINTDYIKREVNLNQLMGEELGEKVNEIIDYVKYHFDHNEGRDWYNKDNKKTAKFFYSEEKCVLKREFVENFCQRFKDDFDLTTKDIYFYLIGLVTDIDIDNYEFYIN